MSDNHHGGGGSSMPLGPLPVDGANVRIPLPPLPGGVREEDVRGPWLLDPKSLTFQVNKRGQVILGRGANSVVSAGWYLGEEVAIKHVDSITTRADVEAWVQEVRLQSKARAPGVLTVHGAAIDVDEDTGTLLYYIVLERAAGSMEKLVLEAGAPLAGAMVASRLRWLAEMAAALRFLHGCGIIHGDLKPGNVMLTTREEGTAVARVADFGSSLLRRAESNTRTTYCGLRGTILYMDPVLLSGAGSVKAVSDVYSFGVMAWQVLTGRVPYLEEHEAQWGSLPTAIELLCNHVVGGGRPPVAALVAAGVPAAVVDVIGACWAGAPANRPAMSEVESVLLAHPLAAAPPLAPAPQPAAAAAVAAAVAPAPAEPALAPVPKTAPIPKPAPAPVPTPPPPDPLTGSFIFTQNVTVHLPVPTQPVPEPAAAAAVVGRATQCCCSLEPMRKALLLSVAHIDHLVLVLHVSSPASLASLASPVLAASPARRRRPASPASLASPTSPAAPASPASPVAYGIASPADTLCSPTGLRRPTTDAFCQQIQAALDLSSPGTRGWPSWRIKSATVSAWADAQVHFDDRPCIAVLRWAGEGPATLITNLVRGLDASHAPDGFVLMGPDAATLASKLRGVAQWVAFDNRSASVWQPDFFKGLAEHADVDAAFSALSLGVGDGHGLRKEGAHRNPVSSEFILFHVLGTFLSMATIVWVMYNSEYDVPWLMLWSFVSVLQLIAATGMVWVPANGLRSAWFFFMHLPIIWDVVMWAVSRSSIGQACAVSIIVMSVLRFAPALANGRHEARAGRLHLCRKENVIAILGSRTLVEIMYSFVMLCCANHAFAEHSGLTSWARAVLLHCLLLLVFYVVRFCQFCRLVLEHLDNEGARSRASAQLVYVWEVCSAYSLMLFTPRRSPRVVTGAPAGAAEQPTRGRGRGHERGSGRGR